MTLTDLVMQWTQDDPNRPAIIVHGGQTLSYAELMQGCDDVAANLHAAGVGKGQRILIFVHPGVALFTLCFACFRIGAIPILIDPGMGLRSLLKCVTKAQANILVGVPRALLLSYVFRKAFATVKTRLSIRSLQHAAPPPPVTRISQHDTAAILFTSGSTGLAKGVVYEHGMFINQVRHLQNQYQLGPHDIDCATFPLFALFAPALGMTSVIPRMDMAHPGRVNPANIVSCIRDYGVTNMFASPAVLKRLAAYGEKYPGQCPSLKRVISAGAPARNDVLAQFVHHFGVTVHTPYGATEALPITTVDSATILNETAAIIGQGNCVGSPFNAIDIAIVAISDTPMQAPITPLTRGQIGEITVKGSVVTKTYDHLDHATRQAKIVDGHDTWHRMGDLGWLDDKGRLWFCGRKSQRVKTSKGDKYTIPCETIYNQHPDVARTALVGIPQKERPPQSAANVVDNAVFEKAVFEKAVLCVELKSGKRRQWPKIRQQLAALGKQHTITCDIDTFLIHRRFPVDPRHNSKIVREKLALWAQRQP